MKIKLWRYSIELEDEIPEGSFWHRVWNGRLRITIRKHITRGPY